jgi:hypothetical protein
MNGVAENKTARSNPPRGKTYENAVNGKTPMNVDWKKMRND